MTAGPRKMGPMRRMPMVRSPLPEVRMALPPPRLRMPPPPMFRPPGPPMNDNMMRPWMPPPPMRPGMMPPRGMFGPRGPPGGRPPIGFRPMGPRPPMGPVMRPRGMMPGRAPPYMRPRFPSHMHNGHKIKSANNKKNKLEEMALTKAWMTDEIRNEIQKKNKLYAKASKNKDGKEWDEFKDMRNKVTRMIRDAKSEYNSKNPTKGDESSEEMETEEMNEENVAADEELNTNNEEVVEEADYENYCYDYYWDYNEESSGDAQDAKPVEGEEFFFCDICAREFSDNARLQKHIAEHEVCGVDGCTYTAHPKLIKVHYANQHATGLYRRMKSITDDEKYIAERKNRFPTLKNLEKKLAEQLEKEERGEVVNQKSTSKNKRENKTRRRDARKKNQQKRNRIQETVTPESLEVTYKGLKMFQGIDTLSTNSSEGEEEVEESEETVIPDTKEKVSNPTEIFCISDEEDLPTIEEKKQEEPSKINSLGLLAGYGSDSNEDEPPEEVPIKRMKMDPIIVPEESNPEVAKVIDTTDVPNVNKSPIKMDKKKPHERKITKTPSDRTNNDRANNKMTRGQVKVRGSQLLEKLLSREIQHERNTIVQCIKYIADNNYFDL